MAEGVSYPVAIYLFPVWLMQTSLDDVMAPCINTER